MFPILIVCLALALVVGGGRLWLKRGRKTKDQKFQQKLDIALGKFDATPVNKSPAPTRKVAPLTRTQQSECAALRTHLCEYMELLHRYEEVQAPACQKVFRAAEELKRNAPKTLKSYSRHAIQKFFENSVSHWCDWFVAADEQNYNDAVLQNLAAQLIRKRRTIYLARNNLLQSAPGNHPEVKQVADVAARLHDRTVYGYQTNSGEREVYPGATIDPYLGLPNVPYVERTAQTAEEARKLVEQDTENIKALLPDVCDAAASLQNQLVQCKKSWKAFERAVARRLPEAPDKPTAQLVDNYLQEMQAWAETVRAALIAYKSAVGAMKESRSHFESCLDSLLNRQLNAMRRNPIANARDALKEAFGELRTETKDWPKEHNPRKHLLQTLSGDPELTAWNLTFTTNPPTADHFETAMRKLAFALAQEKATSARLHQLEEQELPEIPSPRLELPSAAAFIHEYRQWKQASVKREQKHTAREERLDSLQKQLPERQSQSMEATNACLRLCKTLQAQTDVVKHIIPDDPRLGTAWLQALAAGFAVLND